MNRKLSVSSSVLLLQRIVVARPWLHRLSMRILAASPWLTRWVSARLVAPDAASPTAEGEVAPPSTAGAGSDFEQVHLHLLTAFERQWRD